MELSHVQFYFNQARLRSKLNCRNDKSDVTGTFCEFDQWKKLHGTGKKEVNSDHAVFQQLWVVGSQGLLEEAEDGGG